MKTTTALLSIAFAASVSGASGCAKEQPAPQDPASDPRPASPAATEAAPAASGVEAPAAARAAPVEPGLLAAGTRAPAFEAAAHNGTSVSLASLAGQTVVLYFYPKDETAGCTVQAQKFRDDNDEYEKRGAVVLGVSLDDLESHKSFASNHDLPFLLLADTDGALARAFGVSTEGGYARRVTYVIGPDGTITHVFPRVDVREHSGKVLAAIDSIAN